MNGITLNGITRSALKQHRKPIHYYSEFLKYAADCLTMLLFDTLKITNTVRLPVNTFKEAELPADYIDKIRVGVQVGQFVRPLVEKDTLNSLANFDSETGDQTNYSDDGVYGDWSGLFQWWGININTNGENTGGYYGLGAGAEPDTFKIVEERNVIQLNTQVIAPKIVLEYLSDGSYVNSATRITPYAKQTIEAYIDWQFKENSKSYGAGDAQLAKQRFDNEHRILRGRLDPLTPELVTRIMNRYRKASIH